MLKGKAKEVHLQLENCEEVVVPVADISHMVINDVTESYVLNNIFNSGTSNVDSLKNAGFFSIRLKHKDEYKRLLEANDITQVYIFDETGNGQGFLVDWPETHTDNPYQMTLVENELISIIVSKSMK